MCVLAVKYFEEVKSWVAVKNRDRNYTPTINFRKSNRENIERLYIWDEKTRYTEGLNENGVCIVSASLMTKADEKEHNKGEDRGEYYSPDGKKIRDALLAKTVKEATKKVIESKLSGHTFVFDRDTCYIVEGIQVNEDRWIHTVKKLDKNDIAVRTNHGIDLKKAGYQRGVNNEQTLSRISSESRHTIATKMVNESSSPMNMMDNLCYHEDSEPQLNPCRLDTRPSKLKTTGQLMLIPSKKTLFYRPIMCEINFDYFKLNTPDSKCFFELVGMKPIIDHGEE
jgi:hypothetical protein